MDIMGHLPITSSGNRYIMTIIDLQTRYLAIVPIPERASETVALAFREQLFAPQYGALNKLMSGNALEFVGEVMRHLCDHFHIWKVTSYRADANGTVENRSFSITK